MSETAPGAPHTARAQDVEGLLARVSAWAAGRQDVRAVGLVGSWARGSAGPASDVDLIVLVDDPARYLDGDAWVRELGELRVLATRSWGAIVERRLAMASGLEVEVGVGTPAWARTPLDPGTARVVGDGLRILHDPDGLLAGVQADAASLYDEIGAGYTATRQADPRIERLLHDALGDARRVLNVGAGAGSYEPRDREVLAVEPSAVMIAQRPAGAAPVVRAVAEELPFADGAFDATMAVITDHHWADRARGLRELRRVACSRALLLTYDPAFADRFWLVRDYLPGFKGLPGMGIDEIAAHLGAQSVRRVPIPADCRDGFMLAFWARPHAYLDARVRAGISVFARLAPAEVSAALDRLRADLDSGAWAARNAELAGLDELDLGLRLLVAEREQER